MCLCFFLFLVTNDELADNGHFESYDKLVITRLRHTIWPIFLSQAIPRRNMPQKLSDIFVLY